MRVKATLTLTVWYDDAKSTDECEEVLEGLVDYASNHGLLSGQESPMIVDTFETDIETEFIPYPM